MTSPTNYKSRSPAVRRQRCSRSTYWTSFRTRFALVRPFSGKFQRVAQCPQSRRAETMAILERLHCLVFGSLLQSAFNHIWRGTFGDDVDGLVDTAEGQLRPRARALLQPMAIERTLR
ncbi:hypothetical protein SAICODRAFT_217677 [Saitoella complicata NRRL Y-17804]|uniref:uncharacterized protein n=1 Tax=Saitoella complicata (strain BCRC 22490 / CBS 7301 / JCM 7358 / NBRC 10748 / NRRL Y-17804) TaxID=698492 RepID=UPI000867E3C9|nr:uncharacterized protein SAICODRAFT_217677 [Saitoella complicata NRRL Y-17804]ODQ53819.1 hypothetical protein SAICODRAFT_217677 [Saitoella complicata NRRL Y-17804]